MEHLAFHLFLHLLRGVVGPVFYWIGLVAIKGVTLGRAVALPYSELGQDDHVAWWRFRLRRWGFKCWRPESLVIIGGGSALLATVGGLAWCYLR